MVPAQGPTVVNSEWMRSDPAPLLNNTSTSAKNAWGNNLLLWHFFFFLYFPLFVWFFFYIWKYVSGSELKCDARPDGWTLRVKKQTEFANCNVEVCQSQWKLHSDQSDQSIEKFEENWKTLEIELGDIKLENFVDKKIRNIPLTSYILNKAKQSYFSTVICPLKISTEGSVWYQKSEMGEMSASSSCHRNQQLLNVKNCSNKTSVVWQCFDYLSPSLHSQWMRELQARQGYKIPT